MKLKGEVAIVTGGGAGIGRAIALAMAQEGADVAIWDVNEPLAEEGAAAVRKIGRKSLAMKIDVSQSQEVNAGVQKVAEEWGRIDILVNNAGICEVTPVDQIEERDWDRMFAVNVKGVFLCSKAVMGFMMKQKSGKIINLGSVAGKVATIPLGRIGDVKEVAKVAVFLASDDSSYLTGEIIDVNGGQFMD
jgi:NAD(P)-dependent dehydrogenase (short-subunit alcohol dehydrogenase family)